MNTTLKSILHSILLIVFLAIFSFDSISTFINTENGVVCELNDVNDNEDSNEIEDGKIGSEAILISDFELDYKIPYIDNQFQKRSFVLSEFHSASIPTPPPEV